MFTQQMTGSTSTQWIIGKYRSKFISIESALAEDCCPLSAPLQVQVKLPTNHCKSVISTAKPQLMLLSLMQAQVIANNIHSHWYFCLNIKAHCLGQYVSKCIYKLKTTLKPFLWSQQLWTNNFRTNSKTVCKSTRVQQHLWRVCNNNCWASLCRCHSTDLYQLESLSPRNFSMIFFRCWFLSFRLSRISLPTTSIDCQDNVSLSLIGDDDLSMFASLTVSEFSSQAMSFFPNDSACKSVLISPPLPWLVFAYDLAMDDRWSAASCFNR